MSTVAMTRMTSDIQDDSTMVQTTTTNSTENNNPESLNNNNNKKKNGGTRKSDSGVYFAMMLSEYLEKNANELPSDQLTPISESLSNQQDSTGQESKNGSDSNTASSNNHTADAPASSTTVTALDTTQPPAAFTAYKTRHNTEKEDHDDSAEAAANEAMANLSNLIWVPAHKHPQIAPSEFVNWIQVHGAAPTRKGSKVKRQKSQLSRSMSYNDPPSDFDKDTSTESTASDSDSPVSPQDTEARFLPGIAENVMDGKNEYTFDRHSTVVDDSRILAPPTQNRSLLRRSAFSARRAPGQDRRKSRRPQPQQPRHSTDTSDRMGHIPSAEPISLHDHPVSMSEWIDLGSASLEPDDSQHGILSRVHDAESQLFSKIMDEDRQQQQQQGEEKVTLSTAELLSTSLEEKEQGAHRQENEASVITLTDGVDTGELSTTTTTPTTTMTSPPIPEERKVVALRRSASDLVPNEKVERKSSWISGLLNNDKKRKKSRRGSLRRVDDARHLKEKEKETLQLTRVNSVNNNNNNQTHHTNMHQEKKRGLAAFLSRSLSLKAIATRTKETSALSKFNSTRAKTSNTNGSTTTSPQQQQQQQPSLVTRQYIHSYRLPIHVERAVYRLSHMKLANPRRPLHQQVVISNFMFWYLSIINPQPQYQQDMNMGPNNNNNAPWPYQQQQQQQQQQAAQQQHYYQQQTETNEATTGMINRTGSTSDNNNNSRPTPPKMSAATTRRFSDDSIAVSNNNHNHNNRRTSQSSSDEEDNVPLSHYRK